MGRNWQSGFASPSNQRLKSRRIVKGSANHFGEAVYVLGFPLAADRRGKQNYFNALQAFLADSRLSGASEPGQFR
jgi:hypothetical protein